MGTDAADRVVARSAPLRAGSSRSSRRWSRTEEPDRNQHGTRNLALTARRTDSDYHSVGTFLALTAANGRREMMLSARLLAARVYEVQMQLPAVVPTKNG